MQIYGTKAMKQGVIVIPFDYAGHMHLQQRGPEAKIAANKWEVPQGKKELSDMSLEAAAIRELREETGYEAKLEDLRKIGYFEKGTKYALTVYAWYSCVDLHPIVPEGEPMQQAKLISISDAIRCDLDDNSKIALALYTSYVTLDLWQ